MSFQTVLIKRRHADSIVSDEALEQAAARLRKAGRTTISDPDGDVHEATVSDVKVTERGLEATLSLDLSGRNTAMTEVFHKAYGDGQPSMSMGMKVEQPAPCSICDDKEPT